MIKIFFSFLLIFMLNNSYSQSLSLNIDGSSADPSAILDVKSTSKGMLVPRVTTAQKNAISSPATGLLVYQTDSVQGFYFYNSISWNNLATSQANTPGLVTSGSLKNGIMVVVYTDLNAYGFTPNLSSTPTWYSQAISGPVTGAVATDSSIVVYTSGTAYGFARNLSGTPTWYSQALSGTPIDITGSGNRIVVSTSSNLYGFTRNLSGTPTWYSQSLSETPIGAVANDKDCIIIYTASNAYGFNTNLSGTPTWYSQSLSGTPVGGSATGKVLVVYTSTTAYGFARNVSGTPSWYSQSLTGTPAGIVPDQD